MITLQKHSDYLVNKYAPEKDSEQGVVNALTNKKILDKYKPMRTWQAYNNSEMAAYNLVLANKELFLSETGVVQCLITNTRYNRTLNYQKSRLRTFEYPLVELSERVSIGDIDRVTTELNFSPISCRDAK